MTRAYHLIALLLAAMLAVKPCAGLAQGHEAPERALFDLMLVAGGPVASEAMGPDCKDDCDSVLLARSRKDEAVVPARRVPDPELPSKTLAGAAIWDDRPVRNTARLTASPFRYSCRIRLSMVCRWLI